MSKKAIMYDNKTLDSILANIDKCIVRVYVNGTLMVVHELDPDETAARIAGHIAEKFFGASVRVYKEYNHELGCHLVTCASYLDGFREEFEYVW